MIKLLTLFLLLASPLCFAETQTCSVTAQWESVITVTCPKGTDNPTIAKAAYDIQKFYSEGEMRKLLFFSEKRLTPRNSRQISRMSDATFARVYLGQVTYNGPNGFKEFRCKLSAEKMGNCTAFLK